MDSAQYLMSADHGGATSGGAVLGVPPSDHIVQFYEDEQFLATAVAEFLSLGLAKGEPLLLIATALHRDVILSQLRFKGLDIGNLLKARRLLCLDAGETLATFMTGSTPDAQRFKASIGDAIERIVGQPRSRVRAYGEMVDLLWKDGNAAGAIRLEELWNELSREYSFSLLCAYSMGNFYKETHAPAFQEICRQHGQVSPTERFPGGDDPHREIAELQQKARALESEIAHREQLESALRQALAQRRAAEQELRDFVDSAAEGLHRVAQDGTILWVNQAELDLLGYTADEYVGHNIVEFHADRDVIDDILLRLTRHETLHNQAARLRCKDGSLKHVLIHTNVRWNDDGTFAYSRCFTRDITDRVHSERLAAQCSAIVASSDDAIASKTLDGVITSWNPAAERMFGYGAEEAIGRSIRMIIPAERQAEEDQVLHRIGRGEIVDHFETIRRHKDGREVPISLTVSPIKDFNGRVVGASKIARDIAERRRLDIERQRVFEFEQEARAQAEHANRIKDEFLAMLSHELRNPLNAILGWIQIVQGREVPPAQMARALDIIERNARLQSRLIGDLLDVSRIVSGKLQFDRVPVDLAEIVTAAIDSVRPTASAKSIQMTVHLGASGLSVSGDASRLEQAVWNLLSNAVKFTPSGGQIEVLVQQSAMDGQVVVRDSGRGIAPEFLPHVFERFRQADTGDARQYGGLGLGLAIVRYVAEAHGGCVSAASPGLDRGATFAISIPLCVDQPLVETSSADTAATPLTGVRILVVDDDADARELLRHVLESHRGVVTTAASTDSALALLSSASFDVLLADLGMPNRDGYALIDAVRHHAMPRVRELRALAITAYAGEVPRSKSLAAGFNGYLEKPVAANDVLREISVLLR
jgi:PAS domain S-box-containing protein